MYGIKVIQNRIFVSRHVAFVKEANFVKTKPPKVENKNEWKGEAMSYDAFSQ
jgi:hypothetical protein